MVSRTTTWLLRTPSTDAEVRKWMISVFGSVALLQATVPIAGAWAVPRRLEVVSSVSFRVDGKLVRPTLRSADLPSHRLDLEFATSVSGCSGSCKRRFDVGIILDFQRVLTTSRVAQTGITSSDTLPIKGIPADKLPHCLTVIVENVDSPRDRYVSSAFIEPGSPSVGRCIKQPGTSASVDRESRPFSTCGSPIRVTPSGIEIPMCDIAASIYQIDERNRIAAAGTLPKSRMLGVWKVRPGEFVAGSRLLYVTQPVTEGVLGLGSLGGSISERLGTI